jgi:glycopeptide antibiotics resistance protein
MNPNLNEISKHLNSKKSKIYFWLALAFFIIWLLFKYPIRKFVITANPEINIFLGFAPNFFAAITLVFWQTYITNSKPFLTFLCVITVLFLAEFIQLFIRTQTADLWDLLASVIGGILAISIVYFYEKRILNKKRS